MSTYDLSATEPGHVVREEHVEYGFTGTSIFEKNATAARRFNDVLAAASINDAIEYHALFAEVQKARIEAERTSPPTTWRA